MKLFVLTGPDGAINYNLYNQLEKNLAMPRISIRDELKSKDNKKYLDLFKNATNLTDEERIDFVIDFFNSTFEKYSSYSEALIGDYWYKYFATEVAYGASEDLILKLKNNLPLPEAIFYLNTISPNGKSQDSIFHKYEDGQMPIKDIIDTEKKLNFHHRTYRKWDFILGQLSCVYKVEAEYPFEVKLNTIQEIITIKQSQTQGPNCSDIWSSVSE